MEIDQNDQLYLVSCFTKRIPDPTRTKRRGGKNNRPTFFGKINFIKTENYFIFENVQKI
jgi:hypothetical protein